ncbi:MAG: hypothetical protein AAFN77_16805 [Planctomycetota bacterium]
MSLRSRVVIYFVVAFQVVLGSLCVACFGQRPMKAGDLSGYCSWSDDGTGATKLTVAVEVPDGTFRVRPDAHLTQDGSAFTYLGSVSSYAPKVAGQGQVLNGSYLEKSDGSEFDGLVSVTHLAAASLNISEGRGIQTSVRFYDVNGSQIGASVVVPIAYRDDATGSVTGSKLPGAKQYSREENGWSFVISQYDVGGQWGTWTAGDDDIASGSGAHVSDFALSTTGVNTITAFSGLGYGTGSFDTHGTSIYQQLGSMNVTLTLEGEHSAAHGFAVDMYRYAPWLDGTITWRAAVNRIDSVNGTDGTDDGTGGGTDPGTDDGTDDGTGGTDGGT